MIQQYAHIKFLYSQVTFQHVSVAAITITSEVHLHEPKHRYCKLSFLSRILSDSLRVPINTELTEHR